MERLFYLLGCNYCKEKKKSTLIFNLTAPAGEKVDFVDIHKGDSSLSDLDKIFPGNSLFLPAHVIPLTMHTSKFGIDIQKPVLKLVLKSSTAIGYDVNFMRFLHDNYLNPY